MEFVILGIVLLVILGLFLEHVLGGTILSPFAFFCQAMMGVVVPVETQGQRMRQRGAVGLLVLAALVLGVPWVLPMGGWAILACLTVGVGLLFWASRIGYRLEREYLAAGEARRQVADDAK